MNLRHVTGIVDLEVWDEKSSIVVAVFSMTLIISIIVAIDETLFFLTRSAFSFRNSNKRAIRVELCKMFAHSQPEATQFLASHNKCPIESRLFYVTK